MSTWAYLASLAGAQKRVPGRGAPSVAIPGEKLSAQLSSSPAVPGRAAPQVIFLPRPVLPLPGSQAQRPAVPTAAQIQVSSLRRRRSGGGGGGGGAVRLIFPLRCPQLPQPPGDRPSSNPRRQQGSLQRPGLGKARKTGTEPPSLQRALSNTGAGPGAFPCLGLSPCRKKRAKPGTARTSWSPAHPSSQSCGTWLAPPNPTATPPGLRGRFPKRPEGRAWAPLPQKPPVEQPGPVRAPKKAEGST